MLAIETFAELGRTWREAQAVSFATKTKNKGTVVEDEELIEQIKRDLIKRAGRIDRVYDVTIDYDGIFEGKADQRISVGRSQIYEFKIDPDEGTFTYRMVNADEMSSFADTDVGFSEIADFAAKGSRAGKKLNCKPGNMQCGGKCQGGSRACPSQMSPDEQKAYKAAQRKAKGGKGNSVNSSDKVKPAADQVKAEDFINERPLGISVELPDNIKQEVASGELGEVAKEQIDFNNRYGKTDRERSQAQAEAQNIANAVNYLRSGLQDRPGGKIDSQDVFDQELESAFQKLRDPNPGRGPDLVPVYAMRRELGNRVSRRDFDRFMRNRMAREDRYELAEGTVEDATGLDPRILDSVVTRLGKLRTYLRRI